ncbi:unnamed protein product [Phytophthora fragariaefolia]|uniref:Unnamed protein product n=1 Tax=Phytophthora fragariaefolia TaxID=1490495 RepID=A0A9W6WVF8_9STRA|nr:unnamed protein product [Phytophthora fragariaefolia]
MPVSGSVLSSAAVHSDSTPPFSPIPRAPMSPASSTASTALLLSTLMVPSGATPGTDASVLIEIDEDGGAGGDEAASEA